MTTKEIETIVTEDEQRLGVGSPEFRKRHNEIMAGLAEIERRNKEDSNAAT